MGELEIKQTVPGVKRSRKLSTRVDLTPMVDLGFLLITFFVFTTTMDRSTVMNVNEPKEDRKKTIIPNSCAITVFLNGENRISYYEGMPENHPSLQQTSFANNGMRQVLLNKKQRVGVATGNPDSLILIIKPTAESSMQNFVDIMDEVAITGIRYYYVADIDEMDRRLLKRN